MAKRLGPYAPLSAMYPSDDAIIAAGEAAELLFVRGLAFSAGMPEQDGYITDAQLKRFVGAGMDDAVDRAAVLVREGLWERLEGGYLVRAWLKWNRSSDDLGRERKKDRDRKAAKAAEVRAALLPEDAPDSATNSEHSSERIPAGIQTDSSVDSEQTPDGFQPRAPAREAGASARVSGAALHSTPLQNPQTPSASAGGQEGDDHLFEDPGGDGEPPPCERHAYLGRRHGNCRACGTSGRAAADLADDAEFNKFWETYPRKVGKGAARKAWVGARKKTDPSVITLAAEAYRDDPERRSRDVQFTPHPATWLNQERWLDRRDSGGSGEGNGGWWNN